MSIADALDDEMLGKARALRHDLHRLPELSGYEGETAARIAAEMAALGARQVVTGLGGTGVAAVFGEGHAALLIRAELDALPIMETGQPAHRSQRSGVAHLCGHDGHMAILHAVAQALAVSPPASRVILLFQPAEEIGAGARAVLDDPRFAELGATMAVSLHNLPGMPRGAVALRAGPVNCASRGLKVRLSGRTAHASEPEKGLSPGVALAGLIPALGALSRTLPTEDAGFRLATVTHARLGVPAFGVAPGEAEIYVTLRTLLDDAMAALEAEARALVAEIAQGFDVEITVHEAFGHCVNHPDATAMLERAAQDMPRHEAALPMRASEDFGLFGNAMPSAMIFLGAGDECPALHAPDYDFPDSLIEVGAQLFLRAVADFGRP
ncbi:putative hydrolase YxeP [Antarctobacter heliothermus]|uniref:Putative hydrolase YxeP n=1 Tax=Antarctobacter heliothermus TaxID=74033 RepID=A0A222EAE2_9RHOB|nr:amidohydrolase [Antarctobacter heliothermus]ASP23146.1 putative hydrolase YxeP [Antarctobacter heliothermus]